MRGLWLVNPEPSLQIYRGSSEIYLIEDSMRAATDFGAEKAEATKASSEVRTVGTTAFPLLTLFT